MKNPVRSKDVIIKTAVGKPTEKKLTRIYNEAYNQITELWTKLPETVKTSLKSDLVESMETEGSKSDFDKRMETKGGAKSKNEIGTGLKDKLDTLKGKQLTYKEKMDKKKLKNQLKKRKKLEEMRLVKEERRQKKKELKDKIRLNQMKNGGQIDKTSKEELENSETSSDEEDEEEVSPVHLNNSVKQPKVKGKQKNKTSVEEIALEDQDEVKDIINKQPGGPSKKQLKRLAKQELKAEKKKEKKKLYKMKKKQSKLAEVGELIAEKKVPQPEQKEEKDDEVMYNKIDFETENSKKKFKKEKPKTEKDPVKALNKIEELNRKVTELKEKGNEEKASEILSKESWKKAFLRAEGVKVKDNVKLIKKTIKRKENKKIRSTTEWANRKEATDKRIADAQKKRKENIMKKKKEKKQRKIKKSIKKGRVVI